MIIVMVDLLGQGAFKGVVGEQIQGIAGQEIGPIVAEIFESASKAASTFEVTLLGSSLLLIGAAGLFVQTRRAFAIIWGLDRGKSQMVLGTVRSYLLSFVLACAVGLLLLASSLITASLVPVGRYLEDLLPIHIEILRIVNFFVSFILITILFALTYKTLSGVELLWGDLLLGSTVTAFFFGLGNLAIQFYVGVSDVGSLYGAAGSLVVFLLWIYYSAQIFLFGAELIKVHKRMREAPGNGGIG
jgi:membrane protein